MSSKLVSIDCATCQALLPDYVRLELAHQPAGATYAAVAFHIATCPTCEVAYYQEFRAQGLAKSLPELRQIGRRSAVAPVLDPIVQPSTPVLLSELWQKVKQDTYELVAEIPILLSNLQATIGELPSLLAGQRLLEPVTVHRGDKSFDRKEAEAFEEWIALPAPEADLMINLGKGAPAGGKGTLIVKLTHRTTKQPIEQVRVSLCAPDGAKLETVLTDEDGLAFFTDLDAGKQPIQIEKAGKSWIIIPNLIRGV
jgi:hypothetical protein